MVLVSKLHIQLVVLSVFCLERLSIALQPVVSKDKIALVDLKVYVQNELKVAQVNPRIPATFNNGRQYKDIMKKLKEEEIIPLWDSSVLSPRPVSKGELKLLTRNSFAEIDDFLSHLIRSALRSPFAVDDRKPFLINLSTVTIVSFIAGIFLVSFVDVPWLSQSWKNVVGSFSLILPFFTIGLGLVAPDYYNTVNRFVQRSFQPLLFHDLELKREERILYHEAGHLVAGYLCGIPVIDYDINGADDAGLSVLVELTTILGDSPTVTPAKSNTAPQLSSKIDLQETIHSEAGGLLVVAVAGVIAECLVFGDSYGGKQDFPIAYEILRQVFGLKIQQKSHASTKLMKYSVVTQSEQEKIENLKDAYLRWAISKALVLLRLYRPAVDAVVSVMRSNKESMKKIDSKTAEVSNNYSSINKITECIFAIEDAMSHSNSNA